VTTEDAFVSPKLQHIVPFCLRWPVQVHLLTYLLTFHSFMLNYCLTVISVN